jgi:hypothetical protein
MLHRAQRYALFAVVFTLLSQAQFATAAAVNFGAATEFIGSSSFTPLPHIIYAINGGSAGDNQTVNIGGSPVVFESIVDTDNAIVTTSSTFSGTIGQLYNVPTDQASLDEILNSHHFIDGSGAMFSITLQNLSVGQSYRLQIVAPADSRGCCSGRSHDVASAGGGTPGTLFRFADINGDTVFHTTSIIGDFTADATEQEFIFGGGLDGGGESALLLSSSMPFQLAEPQVTINRTTGNVMLENVNAFAGTSIQGYSLLSNGGAFNPASWLSISDNYDLSSGGEVDSNDNWTKAAGNAAELSEFNFASPATTGTPGN